MTGAPFGEVDLDLLADYVAGVLDDGEARRVADLVSAQPAWAVAHRALVAADAAVAGQLRAAADAQSLAMPADVAARIEQALRAEGGPVTTAPVVSLAEVRARRAKVRHRLAVAAAVAGVALVGVPVAVAALNGGIVAPGAATTAKDSNVFSADEATGGDGGAPAMPQAASGAPNAAVPVLEFSGANYTAASIDAMADSRAAGAPPALTEDATKITPEAARTRQSLPDMSNPVPQELARLLDPVARSACLASVTTFATGRASLVDFARYEGRPALVILVSRESPPAPSDHGVVVVGPACGVNGPDLYASDLD